MQAIGTLFLQAGGGAAAASAVAPSLAGTAAAAGITGGHGGLSAVSGTIVGQAAVGGSLLGIGLEGLRNIGTAVKTVGGFVGLQQQAAILRRQAEIEERNRRRILRAGAQSAQDKDLEAAAIIAEDEARKAASGFDVGSVSFVRSTRKNKILAARDRFRIIEDARIQSENAGRRAENLRDQASSASLSSLFGLVEGGLGFFDDFISSGSLINQQTARRITRRARSVR